MALGTLAAVPLVSSGLGHTLAEERHRLSAMALDASVPRDKFMEDLRASMLRYPAEPFLPLMGAARAQANGEGSVVPWIGRALERNPRFGRAHYVLARSIAGRNRAQARLEYRLAYEYDQTLRYTIVREAAYLVEDPTSGLELVPDGPLGNDMLEVIVPLVAERLPSTSVLLDAELERRSPMLVAPFRRRAEAAVNDTLNDSPWCVPVPDGACMKDAVGAAEELVRREPEKCASHVLVARLRAKKGEVKVALDGLDRAMEQVSDRSACRRQVIQLATEWNQLMRADLALDDLVRAGCGAAADCLDLYSWAAAREEGRGHYMRAVRLYRRVVDMAPEREDVLQHIGELGNRDGALADALDAYGTLAQRHPSDPQWSARIAELRAKRTPPRPGMMPPPP